MASISAATFGSAKMVPRPTFRYIGIEMERTEYSLLLDHHRLLRVIRRDEGATYAIKCPDKMMLAAYLAAKARGLIS